MPKSLIVVSDLIEHGSDYSQYPGQTLLRAFQQSVAYKKVRTDLQGAEVRIGYIQRLTRRPINSGEHIRFWTDWVKDSNGRFNEARKYRELVRHDNGNHVRSACRRNYYELWGPPAIFIAFVLAGCAYIVYAKEYQIRQLFVTFIPVGFMVAYAACMLLFALSPPAG